MAAYYNEYDPKAAAWLRELIKQGHIADGVVDERSIEDVTPTELAGFTQCHFFAGIGVWSYALRRAGWADDRPVWTGSCPCQPFSAAGKGAGFDDERHLWPAFHHLISQCRPPIVLGEQVASKDGLGWLDLVQSDLEATGYASGAVDLCAAGIGAPHIRQRLWWVGKRLDALVNTTNSGHLGRDLGNQASPQSAALGNEPVQFPHEGGGWDDAADAGAFNDLGNAVSPRLQGRERIGPTGTQGSPSGYGSECSGADGLADADSDGRGAGDRIRSDGQEHDIEYGVGKVGLADPSGIGRRAGGVWHNGGNDGNQPDANVKDDIGMADTAGTGQHQRGLCNGGELQQGTREAQGERGPQADSTVGFDKNVDMAQRHIPSGPTNGHWKDADWLFCRDGKWRPVEPGTSPLAHGSAARVGRLRGYGNAIVAQAAQAFIESVM